MSSQSMKEPNRFRLWVHVDPLFGEKDWEYYGRFDSKDDLSAVIRDVMMDFGDDVKTLDRYVCIEALHGDQPLKIELLPSKVLKDKYGDWVDRFSEKMSMCQQCIMLDENEKDGRAVCRKEKPWYEEIVCPYYEDWHKYGWKSDELYEAIEMTKLMMEESTASCSVNKSNGGSQ